MAEPQPHFLLVTFPAQGHLNPTLQFAKCLLRIGARVTLATSVSAHRRMTKLIAPDGLSLAWFSDGYDDGFNHLHHDTNHYMSEIKRRGSQTLTELILAQKEGNYPFTCLVYTLLLPWSAKVARQLDLPSALLWIQPATVFDIYYHYFYGYGDTIEKNFNDPSRVIELPGLTPLTSRDLPSFLVPPNKYPHTLPTFKEQMEALNEESNPRILVNTFDELEFEALKAIDKFNMRAIGPLIPSAFLDGKDPSDTSFGGDMFRGSNDYKEFLNSKPEASVVYISFGTLIVLEKQQMEEFARGLLASGLSFLWVVRENQIGEEEKLEDRLMSYKEELEKQGMIVPWCSQVEVFSHPAIGCFVTHCGWNSTLESLVCGVPVVAFPRWTDQGTNAKLIEDVWKTGLRLTVNKEGIVGGDEMKRCLEMVMGEGEKREELRRNAQKWKDLGRKAASDGGSSDKNLKAFLDEVGGLFSKHSVFCR